MKCPTEHQEQCAVITWARMSAKRHPCLKWLYAVPNGQNKSEFQRNYFRAEGLTKGVSDLCLPAARGPYHGLYIEMKRKVGSKTSPEQTEFQEFVISEGYYAAICYGAEQAISVIEKYLAMSKVK